MSVIRFTILTRNIYIYNGKKELHLHEKDNATRMFVLMCDRAFFILLDL